MEDKVGFREGKFDLREVMLRMTKPLPAILLLLLLCGGSQLPLFQSPTNGLN